MTAHRSAVSVDALLGFERPALAAALNLIEDRRPLQRTQALGLLDELATLPVLAHLVGLTGPPGVGKSSLIACLLNVAVRAGRRVGIVAVDPSSKVSGGALLGDRSRMRIPTRAPVYARSFAARDRLGGLSREAFLAAFVLRHVCDVVLIETVGVGQSETDIANLADTVVLVVQPFSGDFLQFIKAGIMEIPDILVVNKADNESLAHKAVADVKAALSLEQRGMCQPVLAVSAAAEYNIDALSQAISSHHAELVDGGCLASRRAARTFAWALGELVHEVGTRGLAQLGGPGGVAAAWAEQPATDSAARKLAGLVERVRYVGET